MNWVRILRDAEFFPDQFVYIKDKIYELTNHPIIYKPTVCLVWCRLLQPWNIRRYKVGGCFQVQYIRKIFLVFRETKGSKIYFVSRKKGSTSSFLTFWKDVRFFFYQAHKLKVETTVKLLKQFVQKLIRNPCLALLRNLKRNRFRVIPS